MLPHVNKNFYKLLFNWTSSSSTPGRWELVKTRFSNREKKSLRQNKNGHRNKNSYAIFFCNKTGVLYLLYWRIIWFKLSIKGISLSYFFWWAPFGYQCFLSGVNEPGLSTRIDPGMALTPFPSSLGWYQIRTHDLLIVSLVCYLLDRTLALLSLIWLL